MKLRIFWGFIELNLAMNLIWKKIQRIKKMYLWAQKIRIIRGKKWVGAEKGRATENWSQDPEAGRAAWPQMIDI